MQDGGGGVTGGRTFVEIGHAVLAIAADGRPGIELERQRDRPVRLPHALASDAYALPFAYFPVESNIPSVLDGDGSSGTGHDAAARLLALGRCVAETDQALEDLRTRVLSPAQVQRHLKHLGRVVRSVAEHLQPELARLSAAIDESAGEAALRHALVDSDGAVGDMAARALGAPTPDQIDVEALLVYDRYFRVIRVPRMTALQFEAQVLATCDAVLVDLPLAVIGLDEVIAIVDGMRLIFAFLIDRLSLHNAPLNGLHTTPRASPPTNSDGLFIADQRRRPNRDQTHRAATYRWIVGHHFFALCAMHCRDNLIAAQREAEDERPEAAANSLVAARTFLRATTAAMWYAGNFPAAVYVDDIRAQMQTCKPGGFSGTQNADYERMKTAKKRLIESLFSLFGTRGSAWQHANLRDKLAEFLETIIEDSEHHTLIAAMKVGRDQSLFQRALAGKRSRQYRALDMLRDMTQEKRDDLDSFGV
jgi:hypothetical protein